MWCFPRHRWFKSWNNIVQGHIRRCSRCGTFQYRVQVAPNKFKWVTSTREVDINQCRDCLAVGKREIDNA